MRKVVISGMIGNGLEWYDFALYGQLAPILSQLFFPSADPLTSLLATYGAYAGGFAMRPLGAILFGWLGDRYGRKSALAIAILMMAIPTACIGLLPTYGQIGLAAPILLTLIRLIQGLSLGGEFSGSIAFIVEHSQDRRRGIAGAASMGSLIGGMLVGSLVATAITATLDHDALFRWGWRVPFLLGLVIGGIGFYIRHHTEESPKYIEAKAAGTLSKTPLADSFRDHRRPLFHGVAIYLSVTVPFYLSTVFMIGYLTNILHHTTRDALMLSTAVLVVLLFGTIRGAAISDRIGRKPILFAGALGMLIFAYPTFWVIAHAGFWPTLAAMTGFSLLLGAYMGPVPAVLVELFPTAVRNSGMAISYNIAAALFGGTAPIAATWLIKITGSTTVIAFYVMACAAVTLIALRSFRDRFRDALD